MASSSAAASLGRWWRDCLGQHRHGDRRRRGGRARGAGAGAVGELYRARGTRVVRGLLDLGIGRSDRAVGQQHDHQDDACAGADDQQQRAPRDAGRHLALLRSDIAILEVERFKRLARAFVVRVDVQNIAQADALLLVGIDDAGQPHPRLFVVLVDFDGLLKALACSDAVSRAHIFNSLDQ